MIATDTRRLPALTSIRFFAALWVLAFHYDRWQVVPRALSPLIGDGRAAVSFFFILSGFILQHVYGRSFANGLRWPAVRAFLQARFARIYPLHALLMVAFAGPAVVALTVVFPREMHDGYFLDLTVGSLLPSWLATLAFVQIYFPSRPTEWGWNDQTWSIACEVVFYALLPFFSCLVLRRIRRAGALLLLAILLYGVDVAVFVGLSTLVLERHGDTTSVDWYVYRMPWARVWEFFLGCVLCELTARWRAGWLRRAWCRNIVLLTGIAGVGAMLWAPLPGATWTEQVGMARWYALMVPWFAAIIVALASGRTALSWALDHPLLVLLGEASYALYLLQNVPRKSLDVFTNAGMVPPTWLVGAVMLAIVVTSVLLYQFVEWPARRWLRHRFRASPAPSADGFKAIAAASPPG